MPYIVPKINWKSTDFFNIEDYNRIKDNIKEVHALAVTVYPSFLIEDMGGDVTYISIPRAEDFNHFEDNLIKIRDRTFPFAAGGKRLWIANNPAPSYKDFNRWEKLIKIMHDNLKGQVQGRPMLSFTLNGGDL